MSADSARSSTARDWAAGLSSKIASVPKALLGRDDDELEEVREAGRGGRISHVTTGDGTTLHIEIDGEQSSPVTAIFCHGYTLNLTSWREQRVALVESKMQCVFYDQRSFGKSERSNTHPATIDQLADDLYRVIEHCAATGPVILVGHSMGAMVVQALAVTHPELFGDRVVTAILIGTCARGRDLTLGLPSPIVRRLTKTAPSVLKLLALRPELVRAVGLTPYLEVARLFHARTSPSDTRRVFAAMVSANSLDVLADYLTPVVTYDGEDKLSALAGARVIVVAGEKDLTTTAELNRAVAEAIPGAELIIVPDCGHMVPLEKPDVLNDLLLKAVDDANR